MNGYHRPWLDYFFMGYSYIGDGFFALLLAIIFFFVLKKRKLAVILLIAYLSTGIVTQIIKRLIHLPRPGNYFYPKKFPFFIDSIIYAGNNSFPSGHTVTAFALASVLALFTIKIGHQGLLLFAAILVGFSRIYLCQHFPVDVISGSFIGIAGGILSVYFCRNIDENKLILLKKDGKKGAFS